MSKERELLKKWMKDCMWRGSNMSLLEETKELLAQPEQEPDEEETTWEDAVEMWRDGYLTGYKKAEQKLKREPLSDDEIFAIGYKVGFAIDQDENADDGSEVYGFLNEDGYVDNEPHFKFVRAIEKAHGIGEHNSNYKERHETFGEGDESDT